MDYLIKNESVFGVYLYSTTLKTIAVIIEQYECNRNVLIINEPILLYDQ